MFTGNKYINKKTGLKLLVYALVIGLFWLKMYYIQTNIFTLGVENANEANILAFNPLSSIFLLFGVGILLARRARDVCCLHFRFHPALCECVVLS